MILPRDSAHAGKTTLLQLLAGKYMVGQDVIRVLGRPAFHDIQLTASGQLSYLGPQWRRDIAFAGYDVPMQASGAAGSFPWGFCLFAFVLCII
jgi:CCR4-NOT complex subunit CAF16